MKKTTKRTAFIVAVALGLSGAASAVIAQNYGAPMYAITYYSDASLSNQVGFRMDGCNNGRVSAGPLIGSTSPYFTQEYVGACRRGGTGGYD